MCNKSYSLPARPPEGQDEGRTGQEGARGGEGEGAAQKGYGLHTILMHQLRGLVVCFKQKKTTGAKSG